jgi:hypothetical protein
MYGQFVDKGAIGKHRWQSCAFCNSAIPFVVGRSVVQAPTVIANDRLHLIAEKYGYR